MPEFRQITQGTRSLDLAWKSVPQLAGGRTKDTASRRGAFVNGVVLEASVVSAGDAGQNRTVLQ